MHVLSRRILVLQFVEINVLDHPDLLSVSTAM